MTHLEKWVTNGHWPTRCHCGAIINGNFSGEDLWYKCSNGHNEKFTLSSLKQKYLDRVAEIKTALEKFQKWKFDRGTAGNDFGSPVFYYQDNLCREAVFIKIEFDSRWPYRLDVNENWVHAPERNRQWRQISLEKLVKIVEQVDRDIDFETK